MSLSPFTKLLGIGLVVLGTAVALSACKPRVTTSLHTSEVQTTTTDTKTATVDETDDSTLTPDQEVDAAIKDMDAASNQIKPDDLSGSDFN